MTLHDGRIASTIHAVRCVRVVRSGCCVVRCVLPSASCVIPDMQFWQRQRKRVVRSSVQISDAASLARGERRETLDPEGRAAEHRRRDGRICREDTGVIKSQYTPKCRANTYHTIEYQRRRIQWDPGRVFRSEPRKRVVRSSSFVVRGVVHISDAATENPEP